MYREHFVFVCTHTILYFMLDYHCVMFSLLAAIIPQVDIVGRFRLRWSVLHAGFHVCHDEISRIMMNVLSVHKIPAQYVARTIGDIQFVHVHNSQPFRNQYSTCDAVYHRTANDCLCMWNMCEDTYRAAERPNKHLAHNTHRVREVLSFVSCACERVNIIITASASEANVRRSYV